MSMSFDPSIASFPRICTNTVTELRSTPDPAWEQFAASFEQITGWTIVRWPAPNRRRPDIVAVDDLTAQTNIRPLPRRTADEMARAVNGLWSELSACRGRCARYDAAEAALSSGLKPLSEISQRLAELFAEMLEYAVEIAGGRKALLLIRNEEGRLKPRSWVGMTEAEIRQLTRWSRDGRDRPGTESNQAQVQEAVGHREVQRIDSPFRALSVVKVPLVGTFGDAGVLWVDGGKRELFQPAELKQLSVLGGRLAAEIGWAAALSGRPQTPDTRALPETASDPPANQSAPDSQ